MPVGKYLNGCGAKPVTNSRIFPSHLIPVSVVRGRSCTCWPSTCWQVCRATWERVLRRTRWSSGSPWWPGRLPPSPTSTPPSLPGQGLAGVRWMDWLVLQFVKLKSVNTKIFRVLVWRLFVLLIKIIVAGWTTHLIFFLNDMFCWENRNQFTDGPGLYKANFIDYRQIRYYCPGYQYRHRVFGIFYRL